MMPFRDLRDCPHCPALYNGFSSSTKPTRAPGVICGPMRVSILTQVIIDTKNGRGSTSDFAWEIILKHWNWNWPPTTSKTHLLKWGDLYNQKPPVNPRHLRQNLGPRTAVAGDVDAWQPTGAGQLWRFLEELIFAHSEGARLAAKHQNPHIKQSHPRRRP